MTMRSGSARTRSREQRLTVFLRAVVCDAGAILAKGIGNDPSTLSSGRSLHRARRDGTVAAAGEHRALERPGSGSAAVAERFLSSQSFCPARNRRWISQSKHLDRFSVRVSMIPFCSPRSSELFHGEPPGPDAQERVRETLATICPYRGLLYFREEDAPFFFGREAAITQLVHAVQQHNLVAVVGASGSGKSSVVRAGLVPELWKARDRVCEIVDDCSDRSSTHALAAVLMPFLEPDMKETHG